MPEPIPPGLSVPEVLATVELIAADERAAARRPPEADPEVPAEVLEAVDAHLREVRYVDNPDNRRATRGLSRYAFNAALAVAYQAGVKHGLDVAETLDETVIEDRAGAELDALLSRLDADEGRRILGELIDRHPQTEDLLDPAPFIRRAQLEAIIRAVWQLLGVVDAW
jgi:hypothetical protein